MMRWNDSWDWWAWLVMSLGMVAFWGLIAWVVVTIVRGSRGRDSDRAEPEAILAERFARGEIDDDEYRTRLRTLGDPVQAPPRDRESSTEQGPA